MAVSAIEFAVTADKLPLLVARFKAEEGGALLRRELARKLRAAVAPAVEEARAGARAISSGGHVAHTKRNIGGGSVTSLGDAIARGVTSQVRLTGRQAGVRVRAVKKGLPRDFVNAPKRMNARKFRHRVFGHDVWVEQVGNPGWFDKPLHDKHATYRAACIAAMDEMARRMAS